MTNVNKMFNNFQCILLRNSEYSFHTIYTRNRPQENWITKGIRLSRKRNGALHFK